jgi:hypothetical protein
MGLLGDPYPQGLDALIRKGVTAEIGVLLLVVEDLLVAEVIEEPDEATPRNARPVEEGGGGLVRPGFLLTRIAERRKFAEIAG